MAHTMYNIREFVQKDKFFPVKIVFKDNFHTSPVAGRFFISCIVAIHKTAIWGFIHSLNKNIHFKILIIAGT